MKRLHDSPKFKYAIFLAQKLPDSFYREMATQAIFDNEQVKKPSFLVNTIQACVSQLDIDPTAHNALCLPDLCSKLAEVEVALGGKKKCYNIERKTRMFMDEILKHYTKLKNGAHKDTNHVFIEVENEVRLYGELIRPDYQLMHKNAQTDTPLLVFEVKRTDQNNLKDHFEQHFKQLRHIAISQNLPEIFGTLTNYRKWYFTRFSLQAEITSFFN